MILLDIAEKAPSLTADIKWTDVATVYILAGTLLVNIILVFVASRLAMRYWHRQKKHEINYLLEGEKYKSLLEAGKAAWGMLAFLTEKENGLCLLIYKGTKEAPLVYLDIERGHKYLQRLSEVFYNEGHGMFLTPGIKQELFHVRTNVYRILDKEKRRGITHGEVLLENEDAVKFFRESYEKLRLLIKTYVWNELKYEIKD